MSDHRCNCKCAECENGSSVTLGERVDELELAAAPAEVRIVAQPDLMPSKATAGAAGFDLRSADNAILRAGERRRVQTGVRIALPRGHEAQVRPRSGLSLKGLDVSLGTVDEDYRGEIGVVVANHTGGDYSIERGDRVAQLVIARLAPVQLCAVEVLDETERGANGFGSTGR